MCSSDLVTKKVQIPPATTCVILGGQQKIILEHEDELHVQPFFVQSSPIWNNDDVKIIASVMNLYDYPHIPPMYIEPPLWYGDKGFVTAGEGYSNMLDKFLFSSQSVTSGFMTLNPYARYTPGGASNEITGIVFGGRGSGDGISYPYYIETMSMDFASEVWNYNFSAPLEHTYQTASLSSGVIYLTGGGQDYSLGRRSTIQKGTFLSGETCTKFGDLMSTTYYIGGINNNKIALWLGDAYGSSSRMQYVEFSSESNAILWGTMNYNGYGAIGASDSVIGLYTRGVQYNSNYIQSTEFESVGTSAWWGNLNYANYEQGACSNGISALFLCGEQYNYSNIIDFASAGQTTSYANWGFSNFDGGTPSSFSGGGV